MKHVLVWVTILAIIIGCRENTEIDFVKQREKMVKTQIKDRGIRDERVISAFRKVERHKFIPKENWEYGNGPYGDHSVPIGYGQTISQPYIVALMTELLSLKGEERVLEIGTGSGYGAAILAELAKEVYTIEIIEALAKRSSMLLHKLGYQNIMVKCGDGYIGWKEYAPFHAIIVTCAPPYIPEPLVQQLAEGGRMVIPVGTIHQELKLLVKKDGKIEEKTIIPVMFVPMTGKGIKKGTKR
ncbi:MAG: protein-L-isoaspartate(D-aspartate) O-methyltransferase [bacterium]|nr:protein-L-isoaspartate(D-aspartate) O-methyltransferase [bacterium]